MATRCVCEKVTQDVAQSISCENECATFTVETSSPIISAIFVIFTKKLPKEAVAKWAKIRPIWSLCSMEKFSVTMWILLSQTQQRNTKN
jgi:hypothetical protein